MKKFVAKKKQMFGRPRVLPDFDKRPVVREWASQLKPIKEKN